MLLYPERRRCRTCRRGFGFTVILRLYCSEECAGLPPTPRNPEDLPRQCRVRRAGTWEPKGVYFTPEEAARAAERGGSYWYGCDPPAGCGMYHLSKNPKPYAKTKED